MNGFSIFSRSHQWLLVCVATLCGFVAAYNIGKVSASLPLIRAEYHASLSFSGALVSSYSVVAMVTALLIGVLVSRFGAFRMGTFGLLLLAAGGLLGTVASSLPVLLLTRVVEGIGYVSIAIAMPAFVGRVCSDALRPMAMGVWGTFVPGGIAISLLLSPVLLPVGGWRALWVVGSVFALTCLLLLLLVVRPAVQRLDGGAGGQSGDAPSTVALGSVFRRNPLLLAGCFAVYSANFTGLTVFLPTLWADAEILAIESAARMAAFVVAMNILGNLTGGWLNSIGVPLRLLLSLALLGSSLFAGLVFALDVPLGVQVLSAIISVFLGGMLPATIFASASVFAQVPAQTGLILGLVFQGAAFGQVFGPVLFGAVVDYFADWQMAALYFIATSIIALVLIRFLTDPTTASVPD